MLKHLASLLVAVSAFGQAPARITFEPPVPTSIESVTVHAEATWPDSCGDGNVRVEHSGRRHTVTWIARAGCGGLAIVTPWSGSAGLGALEPGSHEVILQREGAPGSQPARIGSVNLSVAEPSPSVDIFPLLAHTAGGQQLIFDPVPGFCFPCSTMTATIDGVTLPLRREGFHPPTLTAPAHAPGPVDVTIRLDDKTVFLPAGLLYFDPDAAPDDRLFERVLVPVLYNGPGAFGSSWRTEAFLNLEPYGGRDLWFYPVIGRPACVAPCANDRIPVRSPFPLDAFGQHPNGLLLFLERRLDAPRVTFSAIVRDVSRQEATWGSEMPIVREHRFTRGMLTFPNVPIEPRYRQTLRVYGVDGVKTEAVVTVGQESRTIVLESPCTARPCKVNEPAFGSIFDLSAEFPGAVGKGPTMITVRPAVFGLRYWALISATNNETQHITVITPQCRLNPC